MLKQFLLNTSLLLFLFIQCNTVNPVSSGKITLGNLLSVKNQTLTAYKYDSSDSKNDSLLLSFDCNSTQSAITIESTLDSGKSWIFLTSLPAKSTHYEYYWSPVNNMKPQYEYCGGKTVLIRISSGSTQIFSDTLFLLGSLPINVESPKLNDTLMFNKRVPVVYTFNLDLTSEILLFFRLVDRSTGWIPFGETEDKFEKSFSNVIIKKYVSFAPIDFADQTDNFSKPITLFLKDYSSPQIAPVTIDTIFIKK